MTFEQSHLVASLACLVGGVLLAGGIARSRDVASVMGRVILDWSSAVVGSFVGVMLLGAFLGGGTSEQLITSKHFSTPSSAMMVVTFVSVMVSVATVSRVRIMTSLFASLLMGFIAGMSLSWIDLLLNNQMLTSLTLMAAGVSGVMAAKITGGRAGKYNRDGSTNVIPGHAFWMQSIGTLVLGVSPALVLLNFSVSGIATVALVGAAAAVLACAAASHSMSGRIDLLNLPVAFVVGLLIVLIVPTDYAWPTWARVGLMLALALVMGLSISILLARLDLWLRIDEPAGLSVPLGLTGVLGIVLHAHGNWQAGFSVLMIALAVIASVVLTYLLAKSKKRLRVSESAEQEGADLAVYDLNAYPDFQQPMIRSYHLRQ